MSSTVPPAEATDRIERSIHIQAPRSRVWRALADAARFGSWFGADLQGQHFAPGQRVRGPITFEGYRHLMFDVTVERLEPESLLSWRWHPYPIDPKVDYSGEEPTLVVFTLEDAAGGTLLRVVESGFDKVPPERRFEAFRMNSRGWDGQMQNIQRHVQGG
ncbi:MAG: SRPBCC family protein [Ramlibacter sp.]